MTRRGSHRGEHRRILAFVVVGGINTLFGYGIYALLVLAGVPPQPALALAFAVGVVWNYVTHARLVFRTTGWRRLPPYALVYFAIYAANALALAGLIRASLPPLLAQALLLPAAAVLAYLGIGRVLTGRFPWSVAESP